MAYEKDRSYATFERHDEYVQIQNTLVNQDLFVEPDTELDKKEVLLVSKLSVIVRHEYNCDDLRTCLFPWPAQ